ncbi:MAG: hypothetical protein DCE90_03015 [Pseudanabaena sp.]|nr:MAG: hypothetical protein DCE90_03015 [Pseudanabaena sp.]
MLRLIFYVLLWASSIGLAVFSSQNINLVTVKFLSFESIKIPIGLLLLFCIGLGANCINILMTSFQVAAIPSFTNSIGSKIPKAQSSVPQKNIKNKFSKTNNREGDDFDRDWSDDWD